MDGRIDELSWIHSVDKRVIDKCINCEIVLKISTSHSSWCYIFCVFSSGCLRSWLEQDPVCPTCRQSLSSSLHESASNQGRNERQEATPNNRR